MQIPPDWRVLFTLAISFLVFWFIFERLLFRPFLKLLADREKKLKDLGERTAQLIQQGEAADVERNTRFVELRRRHLELREAARRKAEEEMNRRIEQAREVARRSIESLRSEMEREIEAAEERLGELGRELAAQLAERVMGRRLEQGRQVHSGS